MADVGFSLTTDVTVIGDNATITVDTTALEAADDTFNIGIINQPAIGSLRLIGNGGTASFRLEGLNILDGATIQVLGCSADIILKPADLVRYNNDDFTIEAVDPTWTPSDISTILGFFDFNADSSKGTGAAAGEDFWLSENDPDNVKLIHPPAASVPLHTLGQGYIDCTGTQQCRTAGLDLSDQTITVLFMALTNSTPSGARLLASGSSSMMVTEAAPNALSLQRNNMQHIVWDGDIDSPTAPTKTAPLSGASAAYPEGDGSLPSTEFFFAAQHAHDVLDYSGGVGGIQDVFGRFGDGTDGVTMQIAAIGFAGAMNDDEYLRWQGWAAWRLVDLEIATSIGDVLPTGHPYLAGRPLNVEGGGESSAINSVTAPQPTITITVIDSAGNPIEGAAVHLDTSDFVTNLIDGETDSSGEISATYTGSVPQAVAGWARSGSGPIAYQQGDIAGTITGDFNQTIILRED